MSIFKAFIFPRALVSLLAVSTTTNSAELVGNIVFWGWRRVIRSVKKKQISYHHLSAVVERGGFGFGVFICTSLNLLVHFYQSFIVGF
jgi:hypothetical protein